MPQHPTQAPTHHSQPVQMRVLLQLVQTQVQLQLRTQMQCHCCYSWQGHQRHQDEPELQHTVSHAEQPHYCMYDPS